MLRSSSTSSGFFRLQALTAFSLLVFIFLSAGAAAQNSSHYSSLDLSQGLNLSIIHFYNFALYNGTIYSFPKNDSEDLLFKLGIPTVDEGGIFFPILSSPLFNRTHPSQIHSGFSLGFYFLPAVGYNANYFGMPSCAADTCNNIYMAVCSGSSGYIYSSVITGYNLNQFAEAGSPLLDTLALSRRDKSDGFIVSYRSVDGLVIPAWIANMDRPIKNAGSVSLVIAESAKGSSSMELQLRDGDEVVWSVSNAGMMEIQDTGELLIYNSPSRTEVVWRSSTSDTLVDGVKMTEGMELRSNDSSYLARVEKGAFVLYLNNVGFNMEPPPTPYWIFPLPRDGANESANPYYINPLVYSGGCSGNSSAYVSVTIDQYGTALDILDSKECSFGTSIYVSTLDTRNRMVANNRTGLLRLENDGRLYIYAVSNPINASASATRMAIDSTSNFQHGSYGQWGWGQCDVPMACGPFGVCSQTDKSICSCPRFNFERVDPDDPFQGCKPGTALPNCMTTAGTEADIDTTNFDFVELNSTASFFLFSRWRFNSTDDSVDACKKVCSSNCSCKGFIYHVNESACFFITDGISLLHLDQDNKTFTFTDYMNRNTFERAVVAADYITYLKVAAYPTSPPGANNVILKAVIPSVVAAGLAVLGSIGYFFTAWRKKRAQMILRAREEEELQDVLPLLPSRFSYKDLHEATRGFKEVLGAGGCGSVYAGVLFDGRKVAVKVLKAALQAGEHSTKQFLAEVASVGRTNHQNIVRLVGFCWEMSERLLVYEYVERGALDRWLFNAVGGESTLLDWQTRYDVALGIARGINYLHEECEPPILHFDINPQNILLDDAFVAKLADFGMSRLMQRDVTSVVTGVRGTPGYIAPEWFSHGSVSKKSDVYSMGMVMLELVGGRRILDSSLLLNNKTDDDSVDKEAFHFPSWAARKCEQGLIMEVIDKQLHLSGSECEQAQRLVHIAFWCIQEDPTVRPSVPTVLSWLEGSSHPELALPSFALNSRHIHGHASNFSSRFSA